MRYLQDYRTLQGAITDCAGDILHGDGESVVVSEALAFPDDIMLDGINFVANVPSANLSNTTGKKNIKFRRCGFSSAGAYSLVMTWTLCNKVEYEDCEANLALAGNLLSSVFIRSYGSDRIKVNGGSYYDADCFVYLDEYQGQKSDLILVTGAPHFEHRFLGNTNNPAAIYAYKVGRCTVEGATGKNIAAGGSAPIAGYLVYEGDGTCDSLIVRDIISRMTIAKPHTMVQSSNAKHCEVTGEFSGQPGGGNFANYFFKGGGALATVSVTGLSKQGAVSFDGGGTAATATRLASARGMRVIGLDQNTPAIRFGVLGSNYIRHADFSDVLTYRTKACGTYLGQVSTFNGDGAILKNWNTGNYGTPNVYAYTAGFFEECGAVGRLWGITCENDTSVDGEGGYCRVGLASSSAQGMQNIDAAGAKIGTMLDANVVNVNT